MEGPTSPVELADENSDTEIDFDEEAELNWRNSMMTITMTVRRYSDKHRRAGGQ
jgi:hypothetical protein